MQNKDKVELVLQSDLSSSYIAREIGVTRQYVSQLRKSKEKIDRISFGLSEKLIALYDKGAISNDRN